MESEENLGRENHPELVPDPSYLSPPVSDSGPARLTAQSRSSPRRTSVSPASRDDGTSGPKPSPRQSLPSSLLSLRRVSVSPASRDDGGDSATALSPRRGSVSVSSKSAAPLSSSSREDGDSDPANRPEPKHSLSTVLLKSVKSNRMLPFNLPEAKKREVHQHLWVISLIKFYRLLHQEHIFLLLPLWLSWGEPPGGLRGMEYLLRKGWSRGPPPENC